MTGWLCWLCWNERPGVGDDGVDLGFSYPFSDECQGVRAHPGCVEDALGVVGDSRESDRCCPLCGRDAGALDDLELVISPEQSPVVKYSGRIHASCIAALKVTYPIEIKPPESVVEDQR